MFILAALFGGLFCPDDDVVEYRRARSRVVVEYRQPVVQRRAVTYYRSAPVVVQRPVVEVYSPQEYVWVEDTAPPATVYTEPRVTYYSTAPRYYTKTTRSSREPKVKVKVKNKSRGRKEIKVETRGDVGPIQINP